MKYQLSFCFLSLSLLCASVSLATEISEIEYHKENASSQVNDADVRQIDCNECVDEGSLTLSLLCAKKIKARCIESHKSINNQICTSNIIADTANVRTLTVQDSFCVGNFQTPALCVNQLTANNICSNGTITANNLEVCGRYRATVGYITDETYNLGDNLNFDFIIDDPNGNVTFTPQTAYVAPVAGYYIVTLQVDQTTLIATSPILGIPIANIQLLVNGIITRQNYAPYLSFHDAQLATLTALISLDKGDAVTGSYLVYAQSDSGFTPISGSVTLLGGPDERNKTILKIHYLSSDCLDLPCSSCTVMTCTTTPHPVCPPCISVR